MKYGTVVLGYYDFKGKELVLMLSLDPTRRIWTVLLS